MHLPHFDADRSTQVTPNGPGPTQRGTTLAVIGDTIHSVDSGGRLYTHGALASQIDLWARHFDQVLFCGSYVEGDPAPGLSPYEQKNIKLIKLPQAGGSGLRAKFGVAGAAIHWVRIVVPVLRSADAVHLRTPCNVTIVAMVLARLLVKDRYAIFAGSWDAYEGEAASYRLQRWFLRRWFGPVVHAYRPSSDASTPSASHDAAANIRPGFSPVLSTGALDDLVTQAREARADGLRPGVERALRIVSVGRFSRNKNQIALVRAIQKLQEAGVNVECHFAGDGDELEAVRAEALGLEGVTFTPHVERSEVYRLMVWADLNVLPSFREGYPKVLLEGMSAGALPVAADTPVNRSTVAERGWSFKPDDPSDLARALNVAISIPLADWATRQERCYAYALAHTLDAFAEEIDHIVKEIWHIPDRQVDQGKSPDTVLTGADS